MHEGKRQKWQMWQKWQKWQNTPVPTGLSCRTGEEGRWMSTTGIDIVVHDRVGWGEVGLGVHTTKRRWAALSQVVSRGVRSTVCHVSIGIKN